MTSNQDDTINRTVVSPTNIGFSSVVVDEDSTTKEQQQQQIGLHAHWDCFSGAAGDMMLAACLDAATFIDNNRSDDMSNTTSMISSSQKLLQMIEESIKLGLPDLANEFHMECQRVWRGSGSITAMHVTVHSIYKHKPVSVPKKPALSNDRSTIDKVTIRSNSSSQHHDHDHGHDHHHHHYHNHNHTSHDHNHDTTTKSTASSHTHDHNHHISQIQGEDKSSIHHHSDDSIVVTQNDRIRNLPEIRNMLMNASEIHIPKWVRDHSIAAFTELAHAEASVHGAISIDNVHFHEVGAVDSIVDTVGTLLALHYLNVTSVSCSRLPLGEGMVSTAHGILPVPAPATLRLMVGMPITSGPPGRTGELVTPTAASLLRVLVHRPHNGRSPNMTLRNVGIGAGTKDFVNHPNIIRLLIGEKVENK